MVSPALQGEGHPEEPGTSSTVRRLEERLAKDPDPAVFASLADAYRKAGRTQEAIGVCRDGLARFSEHPVTRLVLVKALRDGGDLTGALAEIPALLAADPGDAQAHRLAGELQRQAGQLMEASTHFRQAAALDASDRESRLMAETLEGGGNVAKNSVLADLLVDDTFATVSFGTVCLEQGLSDEAAQIFLRVLRREPGHPAARVKLEEALRVKTQKRKGS
ncbi:MAG TPA: tetratricopeptide repeat protein [Candidatus Methylomirabilis sp.]|nr:tetratricopeptide repeat protein [Candidatus Methylomirabilis sp.]